MKTKLKNITNYLKNYLKENYLSLIFLILFACFCFYDTGYSIYKPGGTINSSERVSGDNIYESKGTFNMAYVGYMKAKLPYYLLAKLIPSWELVKNDNLTISDNETLNDMIIRDHLEYKSAISNATKVAFDYAKIDYQITKTTSYVYYKNPSSKSNIKVGANIVLISPPSILPYTARKLKLAAKRSVTAKSPISPQCQTSSQSLKKSNILLSNQPCVSDNNPIFISSYALLIYKASLFLPPSFLHREFPESAAYDRNGDLS